MVALLRVAVQLPLLALVFLYGILILAWRILRQHIFQHHSGIPEIGNLGKTRTLRQKIDGTAVICGGSIAGLFSARVCSDFFERVVIVEPEEWLTSEDGMRRFGWEQEHKRTRVMQYNSLHGCQALVYTGLRELFPDLDDQCGYSKIVIFPADAANFAGTPIPAPVESYGGHLPKTFVCSRAGFETLLRRLVLGQGNYSNITQIIGTVIGVLPESDNSSRLSGVKIRRADLHIEELDASLVVDCTGATRAGVKWLSQSGFGNADVLVNGKLSLQEAKISFDQKLHYSTLICNATPDTLKKLPIPSDQKLETVFYLFLEDDVSQGRRLFALAKTDGDRIIVFAGQSSDENVKYESLEAMRSLIQSFKAYKDPIPQWVFKTIDILDECQPEIHASHVRVPPTSYIQYHKTANLPSNFVALGDSVISVDPLYGQGCTKAFLGAAVLHSVLFAKLKAHTTELPTDFSEQFFKEQFNKTDSFWQVTLIDQRLTVYMTCMSVTDYGIPSTTPLPGEDLRIGSLVRWYLRRLQILATKDAHAARVYWDGSMGFGTSIDIFHPLLIFKTLFNAIIYYG
ncbi:hypothetical protein J3R30DRAFT_3698456 [Lentinula aciculospora]|uniref:FAD/NAD(P)-binding domain-containing protein n=1 Tax=Lentinula aciculospora TaxID=153920 RepID=A0A9W9AIX6_9AGAR|nr:hypothetical protein J3R30DRAFT_3698456 [Lentinula aciculospora]